MSKAYSPAQRAVAGAIAILISLANAADVRGADDGPTLRLLNRAGAATTAIVDGNAVRAAVQLPRAGSAATRIVFRLSGDAEPAGECTVPAGERSCESALFDTLGWYWTGPAHALIAEISGVESPLERPVSVAPRPVVLVHGFNSSAATWQPYLGPHGFLAELGLHGYAVGDGQAPGALDTGSAAEPRRRTNSLAQNAAILAGYIDEVRSKTGAEKVDIVAHSMGGLIARNYIATLREAGGVAQLLTMGTPMAGTPCAVLPAALGLMLPATIEIQPSYVTGIFNQRITQRNGSRFQLLAGTPRLSVLQSPCADAPSDLVVSARSARSIPAEIREMPVLHTDMTSSREVFDDFLAPQLKRARSDWRATDAPNAAESLDPQQFTRVHTGHLDPGQNQDLVIDIEPGVTVATFALFDTSRSLDVVVTGASGNQITLDVTKNGLVRVDDPSSLVYLGYGFENPKPGHWRIRLVTTDKTPASGADYAITTQFRGGARLDVQTSATVVQQNERISVRTRLTKDGAPLKLSAARATWRDADGMLTSMNMSIDEERATFAFVPTKSGLHDVSIEISAVDPSGVTIDRAAFLAFEVEPPFSAPWRGVFIVASVLAALAAFVGSVVFMLRRRRRASAAR